ncbi:MAG: type II secretion system protein [Vulcanimicrobiota bacterium]
MQSSTPLQSKSDRMTRRPGFTFIEILVTSGLALMVVTLAFTSLYYSSRASRDCRINTNLDFEIMKIYAQMRQQMLNIYVAKDLYDSMISEKTEVENRHTIRFFTTSPVIGRGIVEADYSIQHTEYGKPYMAYREFPFTHVMESNDSSTLEATLAEANDSGIDYQWRKISDAIVGLTFSYLKDDNELDEWKGNGLPSTIVVSLWYTAKQDVQSFSFTVAPGLSTSTGSSPNSKVQ